MSERSSRPWEFDLTPVAAPSVVPVEPLARRRGGMGRREVQLPDGRWVAESDVPPDLLRRPIPTIPPGPIVRRHEPPEEDPMPEVITDTQEARAAAARIMSAIVATAASRTCAICGTPFTPRRFGKPQVTCSPECQRKRKKRQERARLAAREVVRPASVNVVANVPVTESPAPVPIVEPVVPESEGAILERLIADLDTEVADIEQDVAMLESRRERLTGTREWLGERAALLR